MSSGGEHQYLRHMGRRHLVDDDANANAPYYEHEYEHEHTTGRGQGHGSPSEAAEGGLDELELAGGGLPDLSHRVSQILVGAEELRRSVGSSFSVVSTAGGAGGGATGAAGGTAMIITTEMVIQWRMQLDDLCQCLDALRQRYVVGAAVTTVEGTAPIDDNVARDMWSSCHQRVLDVAHQAFQAALQLSEPTLSAASDIDGDGNDDDPAAALQALQQDGQASVARILELLLVLLYVSHQNQVPIPDNSKSDEVVNMYVPYQRSVLRQRAKPCVAELVQARRQHQQAVDEWERLRAVNAMSGGQQEQGTTLRVLAIDDDHDDDHPHHDHHEASGPRSTAAHDGAPTAASIHHAAAMAALLGMAAQLIHPLLAWRHQLLLVTMDRPDGGGGDAGVPTQLVDSCTRASRIVHEQVTTLVETVASWMADDHQIDNWMERSAVPNALGSGSGVSNSRSLHGLDGLVEELAYSCHVVKRYLVLVQDLLAVDGAAAASPPQVPPNPLDTLLHEWTFKYAALERHLAVQNWHAALEVAQPTALVLGTAIRVPSFVEDAHYLSIRALQRAADTAQSALAVGTVAHALSHDVWSTEVDPMTPHSVRDALTNRHGCYGNEDDARTRSHDARTSHPTSSPSRGAPPKSGDFASAFLEALDQDVDGRGGTTPRSKQVGGSAPTSGNFLSLIGLDGAGLQDDATLRRHLDAEHCMLNGIHAAATACRELAAFLDSLLASSTAPSDLEPSQSTSSSSTVLEMDVKSLAMIQLAREELFRSSQSYDAWLVQQVQDHVQSNSQCLVHLRDFFLAEHYELSASDMHVAESDDRLQRHMMAPLTSSIFLSRLTDTLDSGVLQAVGNELVRVLVDKVILKVLWTSPDRLGNVDGTRSGGAAEDDHEQDDPPMRFTELGALLLSKQVRMLQGFVSRVASNPELVASTEVPGLSSTSTSAALLPNYAQWERLSQVLTALQLEKPSDWLAYRYHSTSTLTPIELRQTLRLRIDFRRDAIQAVVNQVVAATGPAPSSSAGGAAPS